MPIFKPKKRRRQKIYTKTCVFKSKIVKKLLFLGKIFYFFDPRPKTKGVPLGKNFNFWRFGGGHGPPVFKKILLDIYESNEL